LRCGRHFAALSLRPARTRVARNLRVVGCAAACGAGGAGALCGGAFFALQRVRRATAGSPRRAACLTRARAARRYLSGRAVPSANAAAARWRVQPPAARNPCALALACVLTPPRALRLQSLAKLFEPAFAWAARRYQARLCAWRGRTRVRHALIPRAAADHARPPQAAVGAELKKYGLRYDDLLDPTNNLDVDEAMRRLPQHVRTTPVVCAMRLHTLLR
jgi:hypothetical protein